jgi:hypothetical protein
VSKIKVKKLVNKSKKHMSASEKRIMAKIRAFENTLREQARNRHLLPGDYD